MHYNDSMTNGEARMEHAGGRIERGVIKTASEEGYVLRSCDRDGIETPPLKPVDDKTYSEGDKVYFFYFHDGTGKIICGF